MTLYTLPSIVRDLAENLVPDAMPDHVLRLTGDLRGNKGESYILAYHDKSCFFSRTTGQFGYDHFFIDNKDIEKPHLEERVHDEFLMFSAADRNYKLKLPRYELDAAEALLHFWDVDTEGARVKKARKEASESQAGANPAIGFLALLVYTAGVDGRLDVREDHYIEGLCKKDRDALKVALELYDTHSLKELLESVSHFDTAQKLCLLSNITEVIMSDGVLHDEEEKLVDDIRKQLGVDEELYSQIKDVLTVKTRLSIVKL